jgi:hypothetical protein
MERFANRSTRRQRLIGVVLLGGSLLTAAIVAKPAGADTLFATGDVLPGLGTVQQIIAQVCVSPDGGILTTVRGEDGRSAFVCSDALGSRVVLRSGDPEPTGRVFDELQYGSCSFTRDGHVIFSADTVRPVVGSDGQVQYREEEAAIYRAGPSGITRILGTGDQTSAGTVEMDSSVRYSASSTGTVLAEARAGVVDPRSGLVLGSDHWFLVSDAGIALAFSDDSTYLPAWPYQGSQSVYVYPGVPALTGQGEFLALGLVRELGSDRIDTGPNSVLDWTTTPGRVVATNSDLASDGFPYGAIEDGGEFSWPLGDGLTGNRPLIRDDTIVFAARVGLADDQHQTRFFRYTPGDAAPQLVFAPAAPGQPSFFDPWIIDSNTNGNILLVDGSQTMYVARAGQPLQSIHRDLGPCAGYLCPGIEPVGLTNDVVVFSIISKASTPTTYSVTLETDLGTAAGTSCSLLPTVPPDAAATPTASPESASPTPTETAPPGSPDNTPPPSMASPIPARPTPTETATSGSRDDTPPNPVCVGDCNGDRVVSVGELTTGVNILLGTMPMSMCPACEPASGGPMTVDVIIRAVDAALEGCP